MKPLELLALSAFSLGALLLVYAYVGYPVILWILGRLKPRTQATTSFHDNDWPFVSVVVPAYNEESQVEGLLQSLVSVDYPPDRRQILVVSDASTDRTDEIVSRFAAYGVELLRMPERGGKTRAENAAVHHLRGDIIVNMDASIRIPPEALKHLVRCFADPTIGVASGRDVSVSAEGETGDSGESGYVGYEMAIRGLETRLWGIVGASGCFYGIRPELHRIPLPDHLSRDFAGALVARENNYRAISVPEAICYVPRATSMEKEYRRKVRTIIRGMGTLAHKRSLLNPFTYGLFAWMLFSHKVCRWLIPWAALLSLLGLGVLSISYGWARILLSAAVVFLLLGWIGWRIGERFALSRIFVLPAFLVMGNTAAASALLGVLRGHHNPVWEPTRRGTAGGEADR